MNNVMNFQKCVNSYEKIPTITSTADREGLPTFETVSYDIFYFMPTNYFSLISNSNFIPTLLLVIENHAP